jgi:hypothetical protein
MSINEQIGAIGESVSSSSEKLYEMFIEGFYDRLQSNSFIILLAIIVLIPFQIVNPGFNIFSATLFSLPAVLVLLAALVSESTRRTDSLKKEKTDKAMLIHAISLIICSSIFVLSLIPVLSNQIFSVDLGGNIVILQIIFACLTLHSGSYLLLSSSILNSQQYNLFTTHAGVNSGVILYFVTLYIFSEFSFVTQDVPLVASLNNENLLNIEYALSWLFFYHLTLSLPFSKENQIKGIYNNRFSRYIFLLFIAAFSYLCFHLFLDLEVFRTALDSSGDFGWRTSMSIFNNGIIFLMILFSLIAVITEISFSYSQKWIFRSFNLVLVFGSMLFWIFRHESISSFDPTIQPHLISILFALYYLYSYFSGFYEMNGPPMVKVRRLLERDRPNIPDSTLDCSLSVIGIPAAGKTSFIAALYTILSDPTTSRLWWKGHGSETEGDSWDNGSYEQLYKQQEMGKGTDYDARRIFEYRTAPETLSSDKDRLPDFEHSLFPFNTRKFGDAIQFLDDSKSTILKGSELAKTTSGREISIPIEFNAEIEFIRPRFFNSHKNRSEPFERRVSMEISTVDVSGESFDGCIKLIQHRVRNISEIGSIASKPFTQSQIDSYNKLLPKKIDEWDNEQTIGAIELDAEELESVRSTIMNSSDLILITDVTRFNISEKAYAEKTRLVGELDTLLLIRDLKNTNVSNLNSITILANKSDEIIGADSKMKWADFANGEDSKKEAADYIDSNSNGAITEIRNTGLPTSVYFCCTLGGLYGDNNKFPSPFMPVNVIEPIIDIILNTEFKTK